MKVGGIEEEIYKIKEYYLHIKKCSMWGQGLYLIILSSFITLQQC